MRVATSNAITQLATASASETVFRSFSGLTANNTANAVTFGYKTGIGNMVEKRLSVSMVVGSKKLMPTGTLL